MQTKKRSENRLCIVMDSHISAHISMIQFCRIEWFRNFAQFFWIETENGREQTKLGIFWIGFIVKRDLCDRLEWIFDWKFALSFEEGENMFNFSRIHTVIGLAQMRTFNDIHLSTN